MQAPALAGENALICLEHEQKIYCRFSMRAFVAKIESILNNGWQNSIHFHFQLLDSEQKIVATSNISATQRCYIDPFESPCLLLWSGAELWQRYETDAELYSALANLRVQALKLKSLPADNYSVRAYVSLNPVTDKQISDLQAWFKHSGHHRALPFGNNSSLLGSFLTTFAEFSPGSAEASIKLQTSPFFIAIEN